MKKLSILMLVIGLSAGSLVSNTDALALEADAGLLAADEIRAEVLNIVRQATVLSAFVNRVEDVDLLETFRDVDRQQLLVGASKSLTAFMAGERYRDHSRGLEDVDEGLLTVDEIKAEVLNIVWQAKALSAFMNGAEDADLLRLFGDVDSMNSMRWTQLLVSAGSSLTTLNHMRYSDLELREEDRTIIL